MTSPFLYTLDESFSFPPFPDGQGSLSLSETSFGFLQQDAAAAQATQSQDVSRTSQGVSRTPIAVDAQPPSHYNPTLTATPYRFSRDVLLNAVSVRPRQTPESRPLSNNPPPQHGPLNSSRLRTPTSVFNNIVDLANHHGIPIILPPAPRTLPRRPPANPPAPEQPSADPTIQFNSDICSNYLDMLSHQSEEQHPAPVSPEDAAAAMAVVQAIRNSPTYTDMSEFLTSPMESPWMDDEILTPSLTSGDPLSPDILTSPMLDFTGPFDSMPLFGDSSLPYFEDTSMSSKDMLSSTELFGLHGMPTPPTPALDPCSLHASPSNQDDDGYEAASRDMPPPKMPARAAPRRKTMLTGTRKGVTSESLIPEAAPIQNRRYVAPSSTSRKEIPAVIVKKRKRAAAFADDPLLLEVDMSAPPNEEEQDAIEAKRRQNTLAARRSRKRKMEYQGQLEGAVEYWKQRCLLLENVCIEQGVEVPPASPPPL